MRAREFISEKWSQKYKSSINCSNPKGFSQRAHCQGRKKEEDYSANDRPPGPETKPTMPPGTVKVDVSDTYDWYKLGQHISDLKGMGKHDFGKGPPSTIMAFGSEEEEHKYIQNLLKTGLTTTDIDPVDPKQPKGMPRQKTDPTYNVNEVFDQPYKLKWEKSDYGDIDAYAKLDDGNYLSIMFNKGAMQDTKEEAWSVEFFRNNSQEVTGEGDQQRVFATVLGAIQTFIKKYKPNLITFSASKEVEQGQNAQSRARLYDSLVQRYARSWGFRAFRAETGNKVIYQLSRIAKPVGENFADGHNLHEKVQDYLWHGSKSENDILYPQQANDTGGKEESNKNAVYATPNAKVAIAMGLTTPGSDTGMFPNDPQMVLFKGNIRKGEYVYLHKVPKDLFIKHNSREWYSKPGVNEVKPIEIVKVPVDKYLNLIRQATPRDLELQKKYMKENFADGRNPQDKGDSKRHGVPTKASVSTLRKVAKQGGRKGQLAHWMANMKAGRAKKNK